MDEGATNGVHHTKRNAPGAAKAGTTEAAEHGPLQGSKRKCGDDLEKESTKKSKTAPSTAPPVRELKAKIPQARSTSFFTRNQTPGNTAAIPTVSTAST